MVFPYHPCLKMPQDTFCFNSSILSCIFILPNFVKNAKKNVAITL